MLGGEKKFSSVKLDLKTLMTLGPYFLNRV